MDDIKLTKNITEYKRASVALAETVADHVKKINKRMGELKLVDMTITTAGLERLTLIRQLVCANAGREWILGWDLGEGDCRDISEPYDPDKLGTSFYLYGDYNCEITRGTISDYLLAAKNMRALYAELDRLTEEKTREVQEGLNLLAEIELKA